MIPFTALVGLPEPSFAALPQALRPPSSEVLDEARAIVERMKSSARGPYSRVVWFCNDGTVQPPEPYACREHGGGHQHAEYSRDRQRLAELGWPVGTVFTATPWEELWDEERQHLRLRQLPLERYLEQVDDGWVLRGARYYRGRVQVEDEEDFGQSHLLRLVEDPSWVQEHYLLVRECVRTIPHHGGEDRTREVRRLAQQLAALDEQFHRLRIKIHGAPGADDIDRVRSWRTEAERRGAEDGVLAVADSLEDSLEELFGVEGRARRLKAAQHLIGARSGGRHIAALLEGVLQADPLDRVARLAQALHDGRLAALEGPPSWRVALFDLSLDVETELRQAAYDLLREGPPLTRQQIIGATLELVRAGFGVGLLSERERDAVLTELGVLAGADSVSTGIFLRSVQSLRRLSYWALGTVRYVFAEPLVGFSALEPKARHFADDLIRGSVLLPLMEFARLLVLDAESSSGVLHQILGRAQTGPFGINPGAASGPLRVVLDVSRQLASVGERDIVALPETVADLQPVAGILTLSEGNLLSHVQVLARNLGIPNAALSAALLESLRPHDGEELILAVSSRGRVLLERPASLPTSALPILDELKAQELEQLADKLEVPPVDLSWTAPLTLSELRGELSGVLVGPKAANLGDLSRAFPGRVAPAIALPFGIFAEHLALGPVALRPQLERAFARYRTGAIDEDSLMATVASVRRAIEQRPLSPVLVDSLRALMRREFGPEGSYGIFVRSDTNVEDLPQFTGAGLNRTIPHVVGWEAQMAAIPRVWASPFTERAVRWRSSVLARPEDVFASVLLMKSVPATKSGVLVTRDLTGGDQGCTVAAAWGVGGAVDNESAETLVLSGDGRVRLLSEAKAPYQRRLAPGGGIEWVRAPAGAVLTPQECRELLQLVDQIRRDRPPVYGPSGDVLPWDIEFGFVDGTLQLFQIRPLVERGEALADRLVNATLGPLRESGIAISVNDPLPDSVWARARLRFEELAP